MNKSVEQQEGISLSTFRREDWAMFQLSAVDELIRNSHPPAIGYLIWTRPEHGEEGVTENIDALRARGVRHLRTGISWAEWFHPENRPWIKWYIREYAKHFTVLPCLAFTPSEVGVAGVGREPKTYSPPKDIELYARFVREVIAELGDCFREVELWNEWNLDTDWSFTGKRFNDHGAY